MRVSTQIASAAMTVLKLTLVAGQFRHGLGRGDSLKVKLPAAPAVQIGRATLSIEVRDGTVPGVPSSVSTASGSTADPTVPITQVQAAAKAARIRGIVRLEVLIDKKGSVSQARVISGPSELSQSARDSVMQWKYETTEMRGELVEIITQVDVPIPPNAGRLPPAK